MDVRDLRNIESATLELHPCLNVLVGRNAQGKTTLLEAAALLSRGRSFRTDAADTLIRRGAGGLRTQALSTHREQQVALEVELQPGARRLRVDGHDVTPGSYHGRLDVVVYSTERLPVVRGPMRERRLFLDRGAGALWPSYRHALREYERILLQRNAALEAGGRGLDVWDERFVESGAALRQRRGTYVARLRRHLAAPATNPDEAYDVRLRPESSIEDAAAARDTLAGELAVHRNAERRARRTLVGPHRDAVELLVEGREASAFASSGQSRSLLLALTVATLEVYREERGEPPVALLDDLDSELDQPRVLAVCLDVARRGQALVTTAHPAWAQELGPLGRTFHVSAGQVIPA